ncbi:MAG TPA: helix-turn-helix domain-containing protein [Chloroflexota bacterium]|nr:helix-turn-helix domain-containing protein [Chloroflexota bacterium]
MSERPDLFTMLLDNLADQIARRVLARLDDLLDERARLTPPDAYRLDQAARALGLSEREVRRRIARGELASRRVGRAVLVPRSAIETFLSRDGT